jgi:hypothetical protein
VPETTPTGRIFRVNGRTTVWGGTGLSDVALLHESLLGGLRALPLL